MMTDLTKRQDAIAETIATLHNDIRLDAFPSDKYRAMANACIQEKAYINTKKITQVH